MIDSLPQLEEVCPSCNGNRGRFYTEVEENNGWGDCSRCKGSGFIPTKTGAQILSLIRHNSKVTVNAELCVAGE